MKKIFLTLSFLLLGFAGISNAADITVSRGETVMIKDLPEELQKKCSEINPSPKIILRTSYGKLNYDFSKSMQEMNALGEEYGIAEQGMFAAGLATIGVSWDLVLNTSSRTIGDEICVIPSSLEMFVGYQDPMIYISKDLKKDSCQYNVVMRHEMVHHQINALALEYYMPIMRKLVEDVSLNIKPVEVNHSSEIEEAVSYLTNEYVRQIKPFVDEFKQEVVKEQKKLDNRDNYKFEGDLCKEFEKTHPQQP